MAAAAAAADRLQDRLLKQASLLDKVIPELKDVTFHQFQQAVSRQGSTFEWPEFFLNVDFVATPTPPDDQLSAEQKGHNTNAYNLILNKCQSHPNVSALLSSVPFGQARQAWFTVYSHFRKKTQGGLTKAMKNFHGATMANTDTNIIGWTDKVQVLAQVVIDVGGQAGEPTQVTRLLAGLLPEFATCKMLIELNPDNSWDFAKGQLLQHADNNGLEDLTKAGGGGNKHQTFTSDSTSNTNETEPCRSWMGKYGCMHGRDCKHSHAEKGGKIHRLKQLNPGKRLSYHDVKIYNDKQRAERQQHQAPAYPTKEAPASCSYCQGDNHAANTCPAFERDNKPRSPATTFVANASTTQPDFCFAAHFKAADQEVSASTAPSPEDNTPYGSSILSAIMVFFAALLAALHKIGVYTTRNSFSITFLVAALLLASYGAMAMPPPCDVSHSCSFSPATTFVLGSKAVRTNKILETSYNSTPGLDTSHFEWCSDPGTNRFVTNDTNDFVPGTVKQHATKVAVGGGDTSSPCYGDVLVKSTNHNVTVLCKDVLYMPDCSKKLMPASPFIKKGCELKFCDIDKVFLYDPKGKPIFSGIDIDGIYFYQSQTITDHGVLPQNVTPQTGTPTRSFFGLPVGGNITSTGLDFPKKLLEAHWAYGHLNFTKLRKLLGLKAGDNPDCLACTMATSRQETLKQDYIRSTRINHRMCMDLGYTKGYEYCFQLYVDSHTRESYLDVLDTKGQDVPLEKWIELKTHLEKVHWPHKFALVRTDGEPVYTTPGWDRHCTEEGIEHEFSSRHRHDQNGVVERAMQAIGVPFRCMMIQGNAPAKFIPDALRQANMIRNHSPTTANGGKTPREKARGVKLPTNKRLLKGPLFCLVFAHVYEVERAKNDPRGVACVYIGYDDINNAYKVMEWDSGRIYYTADGTWHPDVFPFRANPNRDRRYLNVFDYLSPLHSDPIPLPPRSSTRIEQYLRSDNVNISDIPDVDVPPENFMLHSYSYKTPAGWKEAMASEHANEWLKAQLVEKNSFREHDVLSVVPRTDATSTGARIFKPRVVLKIKMNPPTPDEPEGSLDKFKYRLTIAAYSKMLTQGIDYAEKHANTVRWNAVLVLIAIAVTHDLDIVLFDIATFFLHGILDDVVYMEQPEGWEPEDKPRKDYICKLNKSMYGLPQASHVSQRKLNTTLTKNAKFKASTADDCVFVSVTPPSQPGYAATGTHVDDLISIGDPVGLAKLEAELKSDFKITVKRNPTVIMSIQLERNRDKKWLKLHQTAYVTALLDKHQMLNCTATDTPMDPGTAKALMMLPTDKPDPAVVPLYQALVGALMWLRTRPDMQFTINLAARFLQCATQAHYDLIRGRPLRYLKGTISWGLVFMAGSWNMSAYGDADLAGDLRNGRSTLGSFNKMGEYGAVSCSSKLERKIATSTGQAETYALVALAKEVVWLRHLMWDLGFPLSGPTPSYTDNDGVLSQATKAINHAAAKHYRLGQAYVRQLGKSGVIEVKGISTFDNAADIFTKALAAPLFIKHRYSIMGPQQAL